MKIHKPFNILLIEKLADLQISDDLSDLAIIPFKVNLKINTCNKLGHQDTCLRVHIWRLDYQLLSEHHNYTEKLPCTCKQLQLYHKKTLIQVTVKFQLFMSTYVQFCNYHVKIFFHHYCKICPLVRDIKTGCEQYQQCK